MSYNYSSIASAGRQMIKKFGRPVVLKRINEGVYNYETGLVSGSSTVVSTIQAVFTEVNQKQIDGNIIQRGDLIALISGLDLAPPNIGDSLNDYKILNVETISPGLDNIVYKVQVRK